MVRKAIITGEYEPKGEEVNYPLLQGCTPEEIKQIDEVSAPEPEEPTRGIPGFWLHLLKNVDHLCDMIQDHDEPILMHLKDITCDVDVNPNVSLFFFFFFYFRHFQNNECARNRRIFNALFG
ncbi:unnamed protein product [Gongylonema pulchrum]|uniref:Aldehyde dehydrogenase n=1 Tax=Gongylonema pulchrum TaxID=637853 RepID=A0A183ECS5_9BILA|nr:unnamed protein product [Gongylonema pulchrum]